MERQRIRDAREEGDTLATDSRLPFQGNGSRHRRSARHHEPRRCEGDHAQNQPRHRLEGRLARHRRDRHGRRRVGGDGDPGRRRREDDLHRRHGRLRDREARPGEARSERHQVHRRSPEGLRRVRAPHDGRPGGGQDRVRRETGRAEGGDLDQHACYNEGKPFPLPSQAHPREEEPRKKTFSGDCSGLSESSSPTYPTISGYSPVTALWRISVLIRLT